MFSVAVLKKINAISGLFLAPAGPLGYQRRHGDDVQDLPKLCGGVGFAPQLCGPHVVQTLSLRGPQKSRKRTTTTTMSTLLLLLGAETTARNSDSTVWLVTFWPSSSFVTSLRCASPSWAGPWKRHCWLWPFLEQSLRPQTQYR